MKVGKVGRQGGKGTCLLKSRIFLGQRVPENPAFQ
jgi:hypothetical protein